MRLIALFLLLCVATTIQGCIRKGPYYIYGDYIEGEAVQGSGEAVSEGEVEPTGTAD